MAVKSPDYKFPKSFGACADLLHELRQKRLAAEKVASAIEDEEKALKDYIITNMPKSEGGAIGKAYKVLIVKKLIPQIEDWGALCDFVKKTKRFDFFQRRLSNEAVMNMWEEGKKVPGVKQFEALSVSLTKI